MAAGQVRGLLWAWGAGKLPPWQDAALTAVTAFVFLSLSAVVGWLWNRDGALLTAQVGQYAVWVLLGGFVVRLVAVTAYRRHAARRRALGVDPLAGLPTARPADNRRSTKW